MEIKYDFLYQALNYLGFTGEDYELIDDGDQKPRINWWRSSKPVPTEAELLAAYTAYIDPANLVNDKLKTVIPDWEKTITGVRAKFITLIPGQEQIFKDKYEEAKLFVGDDNTNLSLIPLLIDEKEVMNETLLITANRIIQKYERWRVVVGEIEKMRMLGERKLRVSATPESVDTIFASLVKDINIKFNM